MVTSVIHCADSWAGGSAQNERRSARCLGDGDSPQQFPDRISLHPFTIPMITITDRPFLTTSFFGHPTAGVVAARKFHHRGTDNAEKERQVDW